MPGSDIYVKQVTYGNGLFLACLTYPARLYKSVDGVNWSKIASPPLGTDTSLADYKQHPSLAYGAGRYVLVSDSGRIFSSPDLSTWTASTSGTTHNIISVKYLDSTFYAVGDSAVFLSSPDGLNWTAHHTGIGDTTGSYEDVFYGNGHLVITAFNHIADTNAVQVTYDSAGGIWRADSSRKYNQYGFARGRFYEFAEDSISVTTDMQHWTAISFSPDAGGGKAVFEDSAHVYLLANNYVTVNASPAYLANVSSSDDGIHFGPIFHTGVYGGGAVYFNHRYFIFGNEAFGPLASSTDGLHYRIEGSVSSLLATNGNVDVKMGVTPEEAHTYTSSDFTQWTAGDTLTGVMGLTYDSTQYWALGSRVYTSSNGLRWVDKGATVHSFGGVAYGNGVYIAWSSNLYVSPDSLWYSADGLNWTLSSTPIDYSGPRGFPTPLDYGHVHRVRFLNGHIFVVADGAIMYSTDGGVSYGDDYGGNVLGPRLTDVIYDMDSAKYYFFGLGQNGVDPPWMTTAAIANPFVLDFSLHVVTDTVNGLAPGVQLTNFQSVVYNHGHFVSVVDNGSFSPYPYSYLIWSGDGVHWDSHPLDRETQISSAIATGDSFKIEGTHGYEIIVGFAGAAALPVTLLTFNATAEHNTRVLLTWAWQTAVEKNSRFIIQRSAGSVWENIGSVAAAGDAPLNYSFTDVHPLPGYNDYRLLLMDADSGYQTSEIKRAFIGGVANIVVYPNPAKDEVVVQGLSGGGAVILYDAAGRVVLQRVFAGGSLTLSLGGLPGGVYHLVIRELDGGVYGKEILH